MSGSKPDSRPASSVTGMEAIVTLLAQDIHSYASKALGATGQSAAAFLFSVLNKETAL